MPPSERLGNPVRRSPARKWLALLGVLVSALVLVLVPGGVGAASGGAFKPGPVHLTPTTGGPDTTFKVSFTSPERTGVMGTTQRHDLLTAWAPNGRRGCILNLDLQAPDARSGGRVVVKLAPHRLGGKWCSGTYHGEVQEIQSAVCPHHLPCPSYALLRGIVGRLSFHVEAPPVGRDTKPPVFGGLQRAFACTPGPQRPDQTTPYNLTWQAATDDVTPSSQIVYDIYYATQAGGEDFHTPTWTTAAGVTSFSTPGLPSHGAAYFVVRARDQAGNEDHNTVEQRGVDPCV